MSRSHKLSLDLVEMLLDVYRNDAEGFTLHRQPIDLQSIARESIDTVVALGSERQIEFNLNCDGLETEIPQLTGDRLQLSRVFNNLLSNAIYHSPRGGRIDISIYYQENRYIVSVADRGNGISPSDLPFLFDRFYQAQGKLKGSGLGLYLSRQIVEACGGKIWAKTTLPQGAKFYFSLPI
jgi:two-component system NarL family sensor kinase